jgi:hypothetical protein
MPAIASAQTLPIRAFLLPSGPGTPSGLSGGGVAADDAFAKCTRAALAIKHLNFDVARRGQVFLVANFVIARLLPTSARSGLECAFIS